MACAVNGPLPYSNACILLKSFCLFRSHLLIRLGMKSTSLASRLSGYSVDGRKRFVKDLSHFQSASVDGPLKMLATYLTFYFILIAVSFQATPKKKE